MAYDGQAEGLGTIGGDHFGNGGTTLFRCRLCNGVFATHRTLFMVGLISYQPNDRYYKRRAEGDRRLIELFSTSPQCGCDYHPDSATATMLEPSLVEGLLERIRNPVRSSGRTDEVVGDVPESAADKDDQ